MKAALLTAINQPLEIRNIPDPEPAPGQVRIRMTASGICGTDLHVQHGLIPVQLPWVLGHEPVGTVEKPGAGVTTLKVGDRVGVPWAQAGCGRCPSCQRNRISFCADARTWIQNGGGNSELMIAEADGCLLLPEKLSWEMAAPLFCAGYTVMSGYRNAFPRPGDRVAVLGVGGLGHLALQVAKAMGHETVAVTGSAGKVKELKDMGADEVLVIKEHVGRELQAIGGTDIILSTTNGMAHNSQAIEGMRPEGRMVVMGVGEGLIQFHPFATLLTQSIVRGSSQNHRADLVDILNLTAAGKVKPALELYKLDDVNKIMTRLAEGKVRYRAVVMHEN